MLYEELKKRRKALYEQFEVIQSSSDFYTLQFDLAKAIIECEENTRLNNDKEEWQFHLDRLYGIGDAIAWCVLDSFTIRQLGKYESVRTSLVGQQGNYLDFMKGYADNAQNTFLIFCDLTRCITIGDIILVKGPDNVDIIECKTSIPEELNATILLKGRNGRQFSKIFWLTNYLKTSFGKLFEHEKPTKTLEIDTESISHFDTIPELLDSCLQNKRAVVQPEPGLVYMAKLLDEEENNTPEMYPEFLSKVKIFKQPILAGTGRLTEETIYHIPALNFPVELKYRILIHEVDVNIVGIVDISYMTEVAKKKDTPSIVRSNFTLF